MWLTSRLGMPDADSAPNTGTQGRTQQLGTIKIPRESDNPDLKGFETLKAEKDELGVTWLEFLNGHVPEALPDDGDIAEQVIEAIGGQEVEGGLSDAALNEVVERVADDLSADVREASYVGAREAIQDLRH